MTEQQKIQTDLLLFKDTIMPRSPSRSNQNNVQRRQIHTIRERERRHSMTQEQRQNYLHRRRTNYERRRNNSMLQTNENSTNMNSSDATSNHHEQLRQRRISDRNRRQSMTEEQRSNYLARRLEYYHRSRYPHLISSTTDASDISNNNIVAPNTMDVESLPNIDQSRADTTVLRQICHIESIPWNNFSSNFERGGTSARHSTNSSYPGGQCNFFNDSNAGEKIIGEDVKENVNTTCRQASSEQAYRPSRFQVIGLGWRTTVGINAYDFGRVILRVVRKLKKHVKKRAAWIKGWDLSEKGISAIRHMEENTLFRKKIRPANDQDIKVFYNHRRSIDTTTSM